jgi:hypothetical protein
VQGIRLIVDRRSERERERENNSAFIIVEAKLMSIKNKREEKEHVLTSQ